MERITALVTVLTLCLFPLPAFADYQTMTSSQLLNQAWALDGEKVVYKGEVVGDVLRRTDHTWINVWDGENAIGIRVANEQMVTSVSAGRYDWRGDTVAVTGTFYRASAENGGDLCIVADQLQVLETGYSVPNESSPAKAAVACLLFGASAVSVAALLNQNRQRREFGERNRK